MFAASFAEAAWFDYEERRDLELDAVGIGEIEIASGAGSITVEGTDGDRILVNATIRVDERGDAARRLVEDHLELTLSREAGLAILDAGFDNPRADASVDLIVRIPVGINVTIDDGSGSITVGGTRSFIRIDDGSGSIDLNDIAGASIDDGSGSIEISGSSDDVEIVDGSGSIKVRGVAGSVIVDDGSGSISIVDVERDVVIEESGSGGLRISDVRGSIESDD
jgi:hypothetical protein